MPIEFWGIAADNRSYRVPFEKITKDIACSKCDSEMLRTVLTV